MFFFFQAEDGIRDDLVTGVQTCALPIFRRDGLAEALRAVGGALRRVLGDRLIEVVDGAAVRRGDRDRAARRSEERRVGKSVDLGGRRIIKKKKEKGEMRADVV